jgi:hypothetical protein
MCCVAEGQFVSQEGFCSMELVNHSGEKKKKKNCADPHTSDAGRFNLTTRRIKAE